MGWPAVRMDYAGPVTVLEPLLIEFARQIRTPVLVDFIRMDCFLVQELSSFVVRLSLKDPLFSQL